MRQDHAALRSLMAVRGCGTRVRQFNQIFHSRRGCLLDHFSRYAVGQFVSDLFRRRCNIERSPFPRFLKDLRALVKYLRARVDGRAEAHPTMRARWGISLEEIEQAAGMLAMAKQNAGELGITISTPPVIELHRLHYQFRYSGPR